MEKDELRKYQIRADIVKAMAHRTRLFIMQKINEKRYSVNDLRNMIGCDLSTVSKHINVLKKSGIIIGCKEGTSIYYSLKVPCIMNFMDCIETLIRENAIEQLKDI